MGKMSDAHLEEQEQSSEKINKYYVAQERIGKSLIEIAGNDDLVNEELFPHQNTKFTTAIAYVSSAKVLLQSALDIVDNEIDKYEDEEIASSMDKIAAHNQETLHKA